MNTPLTVKDLYALCKKEIQDGNGDCSVMISDDEEGNGYHYCWYAFEKVDDYTKEFVDPRIAPADKTVILG